MLEGNSAPVKALLEINGELVEASLFRLAPDISELALTELVGRERDVISIEGLGSGALPLPGTPNVEGANPLVGWLIALALVLG